MFKLLGVTQHWEHKPNKAKLLIALEDYTQREPTNSYCNKSYKQQIHLYAKDIPQMYNLILVEQTELCKINNLDEGIGKIA